MKPVRRATAAARLTIAFSRDLVASSIAVARVVLSPKPQPRPRLVVVPLRRARTPAEIMMVANYITLTPGTLTVDVSPDGKSLLVHSLLSGDSGNGVRADVQEAIEPLVIGVTRP